MPKIVVIKGLSQDLIEDLIDSIGTLIVSDNTVILPYDCLEDVINFYNTNEMYSPIDIVEV